MDINIPEILIANGTGAVTVAFLIFYRIRRRQQFAQVHERIFSVMLTLILIAQAGETVSFLIDGKIFPRSFFLQHICNILCLGLAGVVGFLWCLFADYRIYCNKKRLNSKAAVLSSPMIIMIGLLIGDLFGGGFIFKISPENCYTRGSVGLFTYVVLFIYFAESIANALNARKKGISPFFFPIYCFAVPCMLGAIIQGCFYGLSVGWLATSMAMVFVHMELQTANYYMDGLSGLFNRQYMNYYLLQKSQSVGKLYGIILDIDDFKAINDNYGHTVGDRAIQTMGKLLSQSIFKNAIAVRAGGDEFAIFLSDSSDRECNRQMETIKENIKEFNDSGNEYFYLSVSMGSDCFEGKTVEEFLSKMDSNMYAEKRIHHRCMR